MAEVKVTTSTGFECTISEQAASDIRVFRAINKYNKGDTLAIIDMMDYLFTDEQRQALEEHIKTEDGHMPLDEYAKEAVEIFKALAEQRKN